MIAVLLVADCLLTFFLAGGMAENERQLYEVLLTESNYRTQVRPRRNSSEVVVVELDVELNQIVTLNERHQILYTSCFVVATWKDEYLTWNPADFGNVKSIILPPSDIWLPDFGFINRFATHDPPASPISKGDSLLKGCESNGSEVLEGFELIVLSTGVNKGRANYPRVCLVIDNSFVGADSFYHASYTKDFRVHVSAEGRVMWSFGGNLETSCTLDMTFFPFDRQQCDFTLENWAYTGLQVELANRSNHVVLTGYNKNGEWLLCYTDVHKTYIYHNMFPDQPFPKLSFRIYLQRKPAFYVLNIITPCSFIVVMSLVLFWLPAESGEKASLGITVLLSFSVFQLVVADTIPRTSDAQPVLSVYLAFVMGMSALSTINAVVVLYFHHHLPNYPVPAPVRALVFGYLALILGMRDQILHIGHGLEPASTSSPCSATQRATRKAVQTTLSSDKLITSDGLQCREHTQHEHEHKHAPGGKNHRKSAGDRMRAASAVKLEKKCSLSLMEANSDHTRDPEVGTTGATPAKRGLEEVAGCVRFLSRRAHTREEQEAVVRQWQVLGRVIDRMMFFICSVLIITMCMYFFMRRGEEIVECSL